MERNSKPNEEKKKRQRRKRTTKPQVATNKNKPAPNTTKKGTSAPKENNEIEKTHLQPEKPGPRRLRKLIKLDNVNYRNVVFDITTHSPKQVASYTLNFASTPFIIVPALPGTYRAPVLPLELVKCQNDVSPDYTHKFFKYPFEAMLVALHQSIKDFTIHDYTLMTDRSSFRGLFDYALDNTRTFTIHLEKYGNCLLMRREDYRKQPRSKDQATAFEQSCTGERGSNAHYFIGEFSIGKRKVLMRYEIDCVTNNNTPEDENLSAYEGSAVGYRHRKAPFEFMELKTRFADTPQDKLKIVNRSTWFQAYLAGVKTVVVGIKQQDGDTFSVTDLIHYNVDDLLEKEVVEPAIKKVIALLDLIKRLLIECQTNYGVLESNGKKLVLKKRGDTQSFIPPTYPWKQ